MPTFAELKATSLTQKLDALLAELQYWHSVTEADQGFEKHHTQVRAIAGHLNGLRTKTIELLDEAITNKTILEDGRNIESLVLGIRRIWEFFRGKLVQRTDKSLRPVLQLADELAWGCYKPVLDLFPNARREPPLVFLNGGLSPFALSRDKAFPAEIVPGEPLAGKTYDDVLQRLPIPIIGVPWYQTAHLPDLPVVAHETGHAVEHDFLPAEAVATRVKQKLLNTQGESRTATWVAWSSEVFADAWGCLALGPAYMSSLRDFLVQGQTDIEQEIATDTGKYPTATLRILLCATLLDDRFPNEAAACRADWFDQYKKWQMKEYEADVTFIAEAVAPPDLWSSPVAFGESDWQAAGDAGDEVKGGKVPDSATSAARLVAAARRLYDADPTLFAHAKDKKDPGLFVQSKQVALLMRQASALIQPGTRAGEALLDKDAKETLTAANTQRGQDAFEDFKAWAGVT